MKKLVMLFAAMCCAVLASAGDQLPEGAQIELFGRQAIVVDLGGEIGKVAIATCNVGADTPSDMGNVFSSWDNAQQYSGLTDGWYIPSSAEWEAFCSKFTNRRAGSKAIECKVTENATLQLTLRGTNIYYASSEANTYLYIYINKATNSFEIGVETKEQDEDCYIRPFHKVSTLTALTYTTADAAPVTPNNTSIFGATYLNSYYDAAADEGFLLFDGEVTTIGFEAFHSCTRLTSVTIPVGVTTISQAAFYNCTRLTSVTLPNSVTTISVEAFRNCTSLTSVTILSSVTTIGAFAFSNCTSLTSVTIPVGVTEIGGRAFSDCTSLTSVAIPNSVTTIGAYAFANCPLADVDVFWISSEQPLHAIQAEGAFNGVDCSMVNLHVPYGEGDNYRATDTWRDFNVLERGYLTIVKADGTKEIQGTSSESDLVINEKENQIVSLLVEKDVDHVHSIYYYRDMHTASGTWQCWYMPFEAPVSVLADTDVEVAKVAGILFDADDNAVIAFQKMKAGETMKANTPYVIRTSSMFFDVTCYDVSLKATAETSFYTLSAYDKFTFTGNYTSQVIPDTYTLNTCGEFQRMDTEVALQPMRFSMTIESRADSPYRNNPAAAKSIAIRVLGDDATNIDDVTTDEPASAVIYDLMGRRVTDIQSGEVYIINGTKFIAR